MTIVNLALQPGRLASARPSLAMLGAGIGTCVAYWLTSPGWEAAIIVGVTGCGLAATVAGVLVHRPGRPLLWVLLSAFQGLWLVAWLFWQRDILTTGAPPATSSPVNFLFLAGYPLLVAALLLMLIRREGRGAALLDWGIVAAALAGIAWAVLFHKYTTDESIPVLGRTVQIAYGLLDVAVLAAAIRVMVSPGRRPPAFLLLLAGSVALMQSDGVWNWSTQLGTYSPGHWADLGWVALPVLAGAAALHPSMTGLTSSLRERERRPWSQLGTVGVAALVPAGLAVYVRSVADDAWQALPVAALVGLLSLLIVARLVLQLRDQARLASRLELQNDRLREVDAMKDDFVASISHELRTPLTSIRGYLDLVREGESGDLTGDQERFLGIVDRNAERLLRVVGDLLFVARVDAGKLDLELAYLELSNVAAEAVEAARPHAAVKEVALRLSGDAPPAFLGDRARLSQVVDNLVSNALKFTPPGGSIQVRTFADEGSAVLEVSDTGIGISEQEQGRLFERFFRASAANEQATQGTGLGLTIVRAITDAHGGAISIQSEQGVGTTVRVELPLGSPRSTPRHEQAEAVLV